MVDADGNSIDNDRNTTAKHQREAERLKLATAGAT